MTVSECLERAAELIEPEGKWCQGHYAIDVAGDNTSFNSPTACRFCMVGAIWRTVVNAGANATCDIYHAAQRGLPDTNMLLSDYNDAAERTQAEVVAALRKAAGLAKQEGR